MSGPYRYGVWTLLGRCLDKMNISKLGSLQFHRKLNLYWGCLLSVLRVPGRCLHGVWTLSVLCVDLMGRCLDKMNVSKLGSLQFLRRLNLYWGCLGSVLRLPGRCLDLIGMVSGSY